MARYSGAVWKPLGPQTEPKLARKNKIILHTMVGSLTGTDSYFRSGNGPGYDGTESHFGVGYDGMVYQWQDSDYQADAQLEGNDDGLSIETADTGTGFPSWTGSNVPAWTSAQLDAIVDILVWACKTHNIPATLIADTADDTRGIGYHRQGIDPWRKAGCERYSTSYGKICPGDNRVKQLTETVIPRVQAILAGDWLEMATQAEVKAAVIDALNDPIVTNLVSDTKMGVTSALSWIHKRTYEDLALAQSADGKLNALPAALSSAVGTAVQNALKDVTVSIDMTQLTKDIQAAVHAELAKLSLSLAA